MEMATPSVSFSESVICWHKSYQTSVLGRDSTFETLFFDLNYNLIKVFAFLYQKDDFSGERAINVFKSLKSNVLKSIRVWKVFVLQQLLKTGTMGEDKARGYVEQGMENLFMFCKNLIDYGVLANEGNMNDAGKYLSVLYDETSDLALVTIISKITETGRESISRKWKGMIEFYRMMVLAGQSSDNDEFDKAAQECMEYACALGRELVKEMEFDEDSFLFSKSKGKYKNERKFQEDLHTSW